MDRIKKKTEYKLSAGEKICDGGNSFRKKYLKELLEDRKALRKNSI